MQFNIVPAVRLSSEKIGNEAIGHEVLRNAVDIFHNNGFLLLHNVFSACFVESLHSAYISRYSAYFEDKEHADALQVGDRRFMVTVEVNQPFNTPYLYANPGAFAILRQLVGEDCILGSFGSVVSLPGAEEQHVHRDHPGLFGDDRIDSVVPSFAVTMLVPLIEMNEINGTTRTFKGSHAVKVDKEPEFQNPVVPIGSCLLMDYRLLHCGTPNRSSQVRPILYNIYCRPWFRDGVNYSRQPALEMKDKEYRKVPKALQHLFSWRGGFSSDSRAPKSMRSHDVLELPLMMESDNEELKWARGYVEFKRQELVADVPWSRTFKLKASDGSKTYLKVVPAERADEVRITPILAHHFPDSVPGVIAHDVDRGLLLLRDHGGTRLSSSTVSHAHQLLSLYAGMQVQAAKTPQLLSTLPTYDTSLALEDLLFFLCPDRCSSSRSLSLATPAEAFIGAEEAARYWDALMQRSTLIQGQLARADALPMTLTHGDLHAHNAAMTPDGSCVLYDWSKVAAGPAGLSLCNPLLMEVSRATRVLMSIGGANGDDDRGYDLGQMICSFDVLADIIGWDEIYRGLIRAYIDRLAENGYASRDTILEGLPGSLLAGAIRWLVGWSRAAGYEKSLRRDAGGWLRSGLDDILELLRLLESGGVVDHMNDETTNRLFLRNPNITVKKEGDSVFLVDPEGEAVCYLNATAGGLWQLLAEPSSVQQAAADLQTAFPEAPRKQVESDTLTLIANFAANGLVTWRG